jgi:glutamine amidotransferase
MTKRSDEGVNPGLGWVDAETVRFDSDRMPENYKIPHMGWNYVTPQKKVALFDFLPEASRFYFVHSYAATAPVGQYQAWSEYGEPFLAAVEDGALTATQFHPEKSGKAGLKLIANWSNSL